MGHEGKLVSKARRNTDAQEENQSLREALNYRESEANDILRREKARYNQLYKTSTDQLELRAETAKVEEIARKTHLKLQAKEEELRKCVD